MQFRIFAGKHKDTVQCIRSTYDAGQAPKPRVVKTLDGQEVTVPGAKRSTQKLIASINLYDKKLMRDDTKEKLTNLTEQEIADLKIFMDDLAEKEKDATHSRNIYLASSHLNGLTDAILYVKQINSDDAEKIWNGLSAVIKALKKTGHPRPRNEAQAPREAAPEAPGAGQGDLLT